MALYHHHKRTEKATPQPSRVNLDGAEASLRRLHERLSDAEDTMISAYERGQKLDAVNRHGSDISEMELRKRYDFDAMGDI